MALEYEFEILEPRSVQDALVRYAYCFAVCVMMSSMHVQKVPQNVVIKSYVIRFKLEFTVFHIFS